jgi:Flagellar hook-length control protein FliK
MTMMTGMTTPQGPAPGADAATAVSATLAAGQDSLVRLVDLVTGQRVQGTVVQVLGDGQVMLGLLGSQVLAATNLTLTPGNAYDFTVTATAPQIVLTAAKPLILPTASGFAEAGLLGPGGHQVTVQLLEVLAQLPSTSHQDQGRAAGEPVETQARQMLQQFLGKLVSGSLDGKDLQEFQQRLGHDQEARVLRLHAAGAGLSEQQQQQQQQVVALLRQTFKAEVLRFLDGAKANPSDAAATAAARSLVEGFGRIEVDNAHRADQAAPQWLPLPVGENSFLRDARMFILTPTEGDPQQDPHTVARQRDFVVVLLLDLTRLGQVRVDVEVREDAVGVTFRVVDNSTMHMVHGAKGELEQQLREQGLQVRFIRIREIAGGGAGLPVADLLTPPTRGSNGSSAMVDVHA